MIINQVLQIGAEPTFQAEGSFIYVDSADGLIEITTDTGRNYSLNRWDQIKVPEDNGFNTISVRNMHDAANHIVIKTGHGKFYPANDGGSTYSVITDMPSIEIAGGQQFSVNNFPTVQKVSQSGAFTVDVDNFPSVQQVSQNGAFTVDVDNFPSVQQVSQNGAFTVGVDNFPSVQQVSQNGAFSVGVNNFPSVQQVSQSGAFSVGVNNFPSVQKVESVKSAVYAPQPKADFTSNNHLIAQNSGRLILIIKASPSNLSAVWVGENVDNGLPLFAGEEIQITTTAEVNLFAEDIENNCYISEVM